MAAVTFQLVSVQENLHQTTALYADTNDTNTPLNAAQAQGAPVPQDIVSLSGQAAQGQQTGQNQQQNPPPPDRSLRGRNRRIHGKQWSRDWNWLDYKILQQDSLGP